MHCAMFFFFYIFSFTQLLPETKVVCCTSFVGRGCPLNPAAKWGVRGVRGVCVWHVGNKSFIDFCTRVDFNGFLLPLSFEGTLPASSPALNNFPLSQSRLQ